MYMSEPNGGAAAIEPVPASTAFVLALTALWTVLLGIFPGLVMQFALPSAQPLLRP